MKKPLDKSCELSRSDYAASISIEDEYAIYYFQQVKFFEGHPRKNQILTALNHIRSCEACQQWLKEQVPPKTFERLERASKYCCISMFAAVEEPERARVRLSFHLFRNEDPCWRIDQKSVFVSYCPWCGTKMPEHPFRSFANDQMA